MGKRDSLSTGPEREPIPLGLGNLNSSEIALDQSRAPELRERGLHGVEHLVIHYHSRNIKFTI